MSLEWQSIQFAQRIEDLLTAVLGEREGPYTKLEEYPGEVKRHFVIQNADTAGLVLTVDSTEVLIFTYVFHCSCRVTQSYLQVDDSEITVSTMSNRTPIFHYDYVRTPHSHIPAAHINIHASNDDATRVLLACGSKSRGLQRRKGYVEKGKYPSFSTLHFPVGGDRFRPGLEDVLEMLVSEFGINAKDGCLTAIKESRAEYRERQLRALIDEFPDIAYDELESRGYGPGSIPVRPEPHTAQDRFHRY